MNLRVSGQWSSTIPKLYVRVHVPPTKRHSYKSTFINRRQLSNYEYVILSGEMNICIMTGYNIDK